MLGDKVIVKIQDKKIFITNITNEFLEDCCIQIHNIFYCCLLHTKFSIKENETIVFNLNQYNFEKRWKDEKLYVKVFNNNKIIFQKDFQDKTKCFVVISNEAFEPIVEELIIGLSRYTNEDILHYTINYKSKLDFNYLHNIEYIVPGNTKDNQYTQFTKPLVFLDVLEKGYKNAVFIDADVQVRSNIGNIFSYIKEIEDGPIFHKSRWDYTLLNGQYIPGKLLQEYMDLPSQKAPHGVTNFVIFSDKHYNLFKEWKNICFSEEIQEIRKKEFLHDELILNCLTWKKDIKIKLFYFGLNILDEKDVEFFYNHENNDHLYEVNLNNFNLGQISQSVYPYDKSEVLAFHCVKDKEIAKNINAIILEKEVKNKSPMKIKEVDIYKSLVKKDTIVKINESTEQKNIQPEIVLILSTGRRYHYFEKTITSFFNKNPDIKNNIKKTWILDDRSSGEDRLKMDKLLSSYLGDNYNMFCFNSNKQYEFVEKFNFIKKVTEPLDIILFLEDDWECVSNVDLNQHVKKLINSDYTQISFTDPFDFQEQETKDTCKLDETYWKNPWPNTFKHIYKYENGLIYWGAVRMNHFTLNPSLIKASIFSSEQFSKEHNFESAFANANNNKNHIITINQLFSHIGNQSLMNPSS